MGTAELRTSGDALLSGFIKSLTFGEGDGVILVSGVLPLDGLVELSPGGLE